jgi:hypothetical protein
MPDETAESEIGNSTQQHPLGPRGAEGDVSHKPRDHSVQSPDDSRNTKKEPKSTRPMGPIERAWKFICEPQHSNAIMALFTGMIFLSGLAYTIFSALQWSANRKAADAAKRAAETAASSLVLAERPWVKIKHRIFQPLTFNQEAWKGPVAKIVIEDTLENVGPTVALNVLSWEDVIPIDFDATHSVPSLRTARARQNQWCDANRHPDPTGLKGYMLFPKDPWVEHQTVGPTMETVMKAASSSPTLLSGKVGFVLVGCVCYRSSFEPQTNPTHQTRFIYYLAKVLPEGGFLPYIVPSGVASELQLVSIPDGFSAD